MKHQLKPSTSKHSRAGISLIEVVTSTLLISLIMVSSLKTVGGVARTWDTTVDRFDGTALAQQMMSEIFQANYYEPGETNPTFGLDTDETSSIRTGYDDTDDYDEWSSTPPEHMDGTAVAGYTGWTRYVNVQKVEPNDPSSTRTDNAADKGLRRITITVTDPQSNQTTLVGYRSETGIMEQSPEEAGTYVTWVGAELQVDGSSTKIVAGATIGNHAADAE